MSWFGVIKSDFKKQDWSFSNDLEIDDLEIKNSPFVRKEKNGQYDLTEYSGKANITWSLEIEAKGYGIKNLYPYAVGGNMVLEIQFDDDEYYDKIEGQDYSDIDEYIEINLDNVEWGKDDGYGPNYVEIVSLEIDMKNEKDPSGWEIKGTLKRGGPFEQPSEPF